MEADERLCDNSNIQVNVCWYYVLYIGADPSLLSVTMSLSIPGGVFLDMLFHHKRPSLVQILGYTMILASLLLFYSDQIRRGINRSDNKQARKASYDGIEWKPSEALDDIQREIEAYGAPNPVRFGKSADCLL